MSLPEELLAQARELSLQTVPSAFQAGPRRAVSAAYYALLHELLAGAAKQALPPRCSPELHEASGRGYLHSTMKAGCLGLQKAFAQQELREDPGQRGGNPLPEPSKKIQQLFGGRIPPQPPVIAGAFVHLQEARHRADYSTLTRFAETHVRQLIADARKAVFLHRILPPKDAAPLYLLLRTRDLRLG